jgi:hypothetical protein
VRRGPGFCRFRLRNFEGDVAARRDGGNVFRPGTTAPEGARAGSAGGEAVPTPRHRRSGSDHRRRGRGAGPSGMGADARRTFPRRLGWRCSGGRRCALLDRRSVRAHARRGGWVLRDALRSAGRDPRPRRRAGGEADLLYAGEDLPGHLLPSARAIGGGEVRGGAMPRAEGSGFAESVSSKRARRRPERGPGARRGRAGWTRAPNRSGRGARSPARGALRAFRRSPDCGPRIRSRR